jgi:hypothetical protein
MIDKHRTLALIVLAGAGTFLYQLAGLLLEDSELGCDLGSAVGRADAAGRRLGARRNRRRARAQRANPRLELFQKGQPAMNKILKGILKVVEAGAVAAVPGGAIVDGAVHAAIDAHGSEASVEAAVLSALQGLETLKPELIANPSVFNANIQIAHDAIVRAIGALKQPASAS